MITDLERNDLGKVCEFGSVKVAQLHKIQRFAQVYHLVSTVEGKLEEGISSLEALSSCFPGGSITGAPKKRAMEIIEELEPEERGIYTGAIGYLGCDQRAQLNIAIRSMVAKEGMLSFHTGAGIVADSDPMAEYEETCTKALGLLQALKLKKHPQMLLNYRKDLRESL